MKTVYRITVAFFVIFVYTIPILAQDMTKHTSDFPDLRGPYLGQKPPGTTPEIFGPKILQANPIWFWHGSPVFSPDGKEMFLPKYIVGKGMELWYMTQIDDVWTAPRKAHFADDEDETNPVYSNDGNTIYYISGKPGGPIFCAKKTPTAWLQSQEIEFQLPQNTSWGWEFSLAGEIELYTELTKNENSDLYHANLVDGRFEGFTNLGDVINSPDMEIAPYISPDQHYLIFSSNRPGGFGGTDLYISFHKPDDNWSKPINLGKEINTASNEVWPKISPNEKYLFFCRLDKIKRGFQAYWVSKKIIDELKSKN